MCQLKIGNVCGFIGISNAIYSNVILRITKDHPHDFFGIIKILLISRILLNNSMVFFSYEGNDFNLLSARNIKLIKFNMFIIDKRFMTLIVCTAFFLKRIL